MTTSGTTAFNLDLAEIVEEAFERCGSEMRSGYDLRTARRSMNLMLADWANRGVNMWTIEQGAILLTAGTATYTLPADTVDLLEHVTRTGSGSSQQDINLTRISVSTYSTIPNKTSTGRPLQVYVQRLSTPQFTVWPVPDASTPYTVVYWRLRRLQDAGAGGAYDQDVPFRFLPALIAGLAYYLSMKLPGAIDRMQMLKAQYDEAFTMAAEEDREKAAVRFVPRTFTV